MSADRPSAVAAASARPAWFYHLFALGTIVIWSFSFLFIVKLNRQLTPLGVVSIRFDIFAVVLLGLLVWRRPTLRGLTRRDWFLLVALGLIGGPIYHSAFAWSAGTDAAGVSRIDPGLLGLIIATVPVHAGWLARVFLGEPLGPRRVVALLLGLAGVGIVIVGRRGGIDDGNTIAGPLGAAVAAVFGGFIVVLMRAGRRVFGPVDLILVSGAIMVLGVLFLHPFAALERVPELDAAGWGAALMLGVFGVGVASMTWATALSGLPAVTTAAYLFLSSVLAAVWGWLFDATPIGWTWLLGASAVLTGLMVMSREGRRPARVPVAATTG